MRYDVTHLVQYPARCLINGCFYSFIHFVLFIPRRLLLAQMRTLKMARRMKEVGELMWGTKKRAPHCLHAMKPHDYSWAINLALTIQVAKMRKKNLYLSDLCREDWLPILTRPLHPLRKVVLILYGQVRKKFRFWGPSLKACDSWDLEWGSGISFLTSLQVTYAHSSWIQELGVLPAATKEETVRISAIWLSPPHASHVHMCTQMNGGRMQSGRSYISH